jgi:hypothetical protein
MEFTYEWYKEFIIKAKSKGYIFSNYNNYINADKSIILRHDVDMSIEKALIMAELENEMKVQSTYFVLITSNFYNLFNKKTKEKLRKILSYGHQIGLHFDEKQYSLNNHKDLEQKILDEVDIIERYLNTSVVIYSNHRPSKFELESDLKESYKIKSAYSDEFFVKMKYFSDSRMNWRENFDMAIDDSKLSRIQVCIHPIWYEDVELDISKIISKFISESNDMTISNLRDNIKNFEEILEVNDEV